MNIVTGLTMRDRRRLQISNDFYYEVLKRMAEEISAWRESTRNNVPKPTV